MPKRLVLVFTLAAFFSACDYLGSSPPPWLRTYPPPAASTYYSPQSYSYHRSRTPERIHTAHHSAPHQPNSARASDLGESSASLDRNAPAAAPAVANPPVSISLAGDNGDRTRAQHLLEQADANLQRARTQHLSVSQKETYRRASQLANRARHALADNDCAAASSLAGKAVSLASGLRGR